MNDKRLTARDGLKKTAYFPRCFEEPCNGGGCHDDLCPFMQEAAEKLARYEEEEEEERKAAEEAAVEERARVLMIDLVRRYIKDRDEVLCDAINRQHSVEDMWTNHIIAGEMTDLFHMANYADMNLNIKWKQVDERIYIPESVTLDGECLYRRED